MRVLFLANGRSIHTQRWVEALAQRGLEILLVTRDGLGEWKPPPAVKVQQLRKMFGNAGYFIDSLALKRSVLSFRPQILNAHYASGYGTSAMLAGFKPTLLSVWGSDVFDFPYQSWFKGKLVTANLRRATRIASTSHVMAQQVARIAPSVEPVLVTPFGVDCDCFSPKEVKREPPEVITIGTVKTLAPKYGVDLLIRAFSELLRDGEICEMGLAGFLRLLVVGGGPMLDELETTAVELRVRNVTRFVGQVPHSSVPDWLNRLDIYVAPSRYESESFGVAVIEASACGIPVIVSDVGGLPEVVCDGETGFVVGRENVIELVKQLKILVLDEAKRREMGKKGRRWVLQKYEWSRCVDTMIDAYEKTLNPAMEKCHI